MVCRAHGSQGRAGAEPGARARPSLAYRAPVPGLHAGREPGAASAWRRARRSAANRGCLRCALKFCADCRVDPAPRAAQIPAQDGRRSGALRAGRWNCKRSSTSRRVRCSVPARCGQRAGTRPYARAARGQVDSDPAGFGGAYRRLCESLRFTTTATDRRPEISAARPHTAKGGAENAAALVAQRRIAALWAAPAGLHRCCIPRARRSEIRAR